MPILKVRTLHYYFFNTFNNTFYSNHSQNVAIFNIQQYYSQNAIYGTHMPLNEGDNEYDDDNNEIFVPNQDGIGRYWCKIPDISRLPDLKVSWDQTAYGFGIEERWCEVIFQLNSST